MTIQALKRRFDELLVQLDGVEKTKTFVRSSITGGRDQVDADLLLGWRVSARNLLLQACGRESEHYREFKHTEMNRSMSMSDYRIMQDLKAVFSAAKEDYEGGFLRSVRSFVHAELFDDELEQATELLASGYKAAAVVVAGVVLETTLRKLC